MALAVDFRKFTPKDSRADLIRKIEDAPAEHAEALLEAYELLQRLHDKGLIGVANGMLSASDTVVDKVVDVASSKPAVTALRIGLMFGNLLGTLDPDRVSAILSPKDSKPPSLWHIFKDATSKEARVGLATSIGLLKALGDAIAKK